MNLLARDQMEKQLNSLKEMFKTNDPTEEISRTGASADQNDVITEEFKQELKKENQQLEELSKEMEKILSNSNKVEFNFDIDMEF
eukprot:CAMPEP_0116972502 /NCGR_PEP_ID=MMETSP0467-20121206/53891_1 /TAXON_ID=283647 /ORGANISM="Mesodinium pulex, Strain SPMC105" /LENGTH=84 /DNA_ID=CAMNT_0004664027 /DNA_START=962 /DNA_END=1216 /DNA_ORIENTATION=-